MKERPARTEPKSSETDPPAANQPVDDGEQEVSGNAKATPGAAAGHSSASSSPQVPPGKPDGEVDTRR